jgi:hypothetical protein
VIISVAREGKSSALSGNTLILHVKRCADKSPAFAQSVQDSNTYPAVPDTPQAGNLLGEQDFDVTDPTGAILVPVPASYLDTPGYDPGYDI